MIERKSPHNIIYNAYTENLWNEVKNIRIQLIKCNGECECLRVCLCVYFHSVNTWLSGWFYSFDHVMIVVTVWNSRAQFQFGSILKNECMLWIVECQTSIVNGGKEYLVAVGTLIYRRRTNGHLLNSSIASILCRCCCCALVLFCFDYYNASIVIVAVLCSDDGGDCGHGDGDGDGSYCQRQHMNKRFLVKTQVQFSATIQTI